MNVGCKQSYVLSPGHFLPSATRCHKLKKGSRRPTWSNLDTLSLDRYYAARPETGMSKSDVSEWINVFVSVIVFVFRAENLNSNELGATVGAVISYKGYFIV